MPRLLLVRHAPVVVDPLRPAASWHLSDEGRAASTRLAEYLRRHDPVVVVSSVEAKACETAAAVADAIGAPWTTAPGLHEHDRTGVPVMNAEEWHRRLRAAMERPDELVLGCETARGATERFAHALDAVLAAHPGVTVVVVAHGTVISLLVAAHNPVDVFAFWEHLGMPSIVVLEVPGLRICEVISDI